MSVRDHNIGNSDYAKHKIQPWELWIQYKLNPFDADILKRTLRTKAEGGMTPQEARKLDYQKIIHISQERIRQIDEGITWFVESINPNITIEMVIEEYNLDAQDALIVRSILGRSVNDRYTYSAIIEAAEYKENKIA